MKNKTLIELRLPDGSTKRVLVPTALAKSKAGQRAFASGDVGGAPQLSVKDVKAFDTGRIGRSAHAKPTKARA
jgi:hypothetical protein